MKREGQKVEGDENGGQVLFAVAEIVFEIVTFGFGVESIMPGVRRLR
jgi:hypothetical protein